MGRRSTANHYLHRCWFCQQILTLTVTWKCIYISVFHVNCSTHPCPNFKYILAKPEFRACMSNYISLFLKWSLHWRHDGHDSVSKHQPHDCLLNRLFRRRSKKISKLHATGLCAGNSPESGEFPAQMASNAENVSIWWRHHDAITYPCLNLHSI